MSNALTDAIEERRRSTAAKSRSIAVEDATRFAAFRSTLIAAYRGEALAPGAFDDGLAAAAELAAQDVAGLARPISMSEWTAELVDVSAFGGKKLTIASPEADRLEFFFDANASLYLGGLTTTVDGAPVSIPIKRADSSGHGPIEIIVNGLDAAPPTATGESAPSFTGAQQAQTALGAVVAAAGLAADSIAALRRPPAPPSPPQTSVARPVPPERIEPEQERYCRQCGKTRRSGDRFCAYCGADFAAGSAADSSNGHRLTRANDGNATACRACGGAVKPTWKFCRACGARLS